MATSRVPWNAVANAAMEGVPIAPDLAVDGDGRATTIADQVRALFPIDGYKGSGLGLIIDVLCALLSGAPYGPDIPQMYGDIDKKRHLGGLIGAIDIRHFVSLDAFCERLNVMLARWGALSPAEPGGRVLYPGEWEFLMRAERTRTGIPIGLQLLAELNEMASSFRLAPLSAEASPREAVRPPHFANEAPLRDSEHQL